MICSPALPAFRTLYEAGTPQVVWTRLAADLETPVSAYLKLADSSNTFLLESVERGKRGRYSIIGFAPDLIWRCHGDKAEINRSALTDARAFEAESLPVIESFKALVRDCAIDLPQELPAISAGLFGYMGYDTVRLMERLPDDNPDLIGVPDGVYLRPTVVVCFDTITDELLIVTPVRPAGDVDAGTAHADARDRLQAVLAKVQAPLKNAHRGDGVVDAVNAEPTSNLTPEAFYGMVAKAKDYIMAGDIFQVVLSQRFSLPFKLPPFAFYRSLRRINPSPFMFFLDFGGYQVIGASPEILVRLTNDEVMVRPIAGTRKRGATAREDAELEADLLADHKERAEHLMLLDLGRNDVGRVARPGTVKVVEGRQEVVEYYSHVMHIVSDVVGRIDPRYDAMDALFAGFPAGTVSGAPKVRAMEIIDELEPVRRGVYAGSVGYVSAAGDMDTCIALRTAVLKNEMLHIQAGAGIVADSVPENEHQECRNKARALVKAAWEAQRFFGN